jgi:2-keto-4-pentenoate hydratase/2-oxohepta-3-ene-1,7-dioic acid hydratase in catechol pathway
MTYRITRNSRNEVIVEAPTPLTLRWIIGVGRNYADHAAERGADVPDRPMLFTKNPMTLATREEPIIIPKCCQDPPQTDYEAELAIIICKPAKNLTPQNALAPDGPVLGYTCANDVSARWWQKQGAGGQFHRGKSFDTFCPLGPHVVPLADIPDPHNLSITGTLNDQVVQSDTTASMVFPLPDLLARITEGVTLLPGTVILTGTPAGVGAAQKPPRFLKDGDTFEVTIDSIGTLRNTVQSES